MRIVAILRMRTECPIFQECRDLYDKTTAGVFPEDEISDVSFVHSRDLPAPERGQGQYARGHWAIPCAVSLSSSYGMEKK